MSEAPAYESEDVAAQREQRDLTDRVAVRLVRRSRSRNLKLGTWARRLGIGQSHRDDAPVS